MTYGFRLMVILTHGRRFEGGGMAVPLELAPPIGAVTFRTFEPGTPYGDSGRLIFTGSGYETKDAAEAAGGHLKSAVRVAAVDIRQGIDVGKDVTLTQLGQGPIDAAAEHGVQLLNEVHGLLTYEETGNPQALSAHATVQVQSPVAPFLETIKGRAATALSLDEKRSFACDVFAASRFESSERSRLLALVTVLDVLADRQPRTGRAGELASEFKQAAKDAHRTARSQHADGSQVAQLDALIGGATDLARESSGTAIQRLVSWIPEESLSRGSSAQQVARLAYRARSQLLHAGVTEVDLRALIDPLDDLVARLCTDSMLTVSDVADLLRCSPSTIRRRIRAGELKAVREHGRFLIAREAVHASRGPRATQR